MNKRAIHTTHVMSKVHFSDNFAWDIHKAEIEDNIGKFMVTWVHVYDEFKNRYQL